MKTINVTFENKDYENLIKVKKDKSWHDFIISCALDQVKGSLQEDK